MFKMNLHDTFGYLNTSYSQKKGRELNCQFDSQPLKVKNLPDFLANMWHTTYCWKNLNKGYNFASDFTSIEGLHTKLWAPKVAKVLILGILGLTLGSLGTKWHLGASPMAKHREYYKGGRWWLPSNLGHGEYCEFMFTHGSFVHQKCSDYALTNLLFSLCKFVWIIESLVTGRSPIPKLQHALLPPKCCESRSAPKLFLLLLSSPLDS
jgi:hypothetical protein